MRIEEFNALDADAAAALVAPCVRHPGWVRAVVDGRPYADTSAAVGAGLAHAETWTDADVEAALADHPRIGERPTDDGACAAWSRAEQAGVDPADADVRARLAAGNAAYEARFGRIYLVRAKGRSADELVALLEERLTHDPSTEAEVTRAQLAEIAALRLQDLLS